jgi:hypothetical protein
VYAEARAMALNQIRRRGLKVALEQTGLEVILLRSVQTKNVRATQCDNQPWSK